MVVIELCIGIGKHETSITQDHKMLGPITLERRLDAEGVLSSMLVQQGLVMIDDKWSYDLDGCLSQWKTPIVYMPHEYWEAQISVVEEDPSLFVELAFIPKDEWPLWLKFYRPIGNTDPNKKIPAIL